MIKLGLLFVVLFLVPSAQAQTPVPLDDVEAVVIGTAFQCHVGLQEPTGAVAIPQSVSLFEEEDLAGHTKNCTNLVAGATDVHISFNQAFVPGRIPIMKAMAFTEPNCGGLASTPSLNGCEVRHLVAPPFILAPDHQ